MKVVRNIDEKIEVDVGTVLKIEISDEPFPILTPLKIAN